VFQAAVAALSVALLVLSWVHFREAPPQGRDTAVRKFAFVPEGFDIAEGRGAIAPNGRHIAYVAGRPRRLWIQDLDQTVPRDIEATTDAVRPFWSPGSDFVGSVTGQELAKVAVTGGPVTLLCKMPGSTSYFSGAWGPDGETIVFTSDAPTRLFEVSARGGTPKLLIEPDAAEHSSFLANPFFLPPEAGSRILAFSLGNAFTGELVIQNLNSGERHQPAITGASFAYSATGHILYQTSNLTSGELSAVPFSLQTLTETGEVFPVAQNAGWPTVATDGTLVYREEPGPRQEQLVWRGLNGQKLAEIDQPHQELQHPTLSPDGRRVVFIAGRSDNHDVWIYDLTQETRVRVTQGIGDNRFPAWSPANTEVAFTSYRDGNQNIFLRQSDGTGQERMLTRNPGIEVLSDWSWEREILLYYRIAPTTQRDLWFLQNSAQGELQFHPLIETPFNEREATLSPDGRWLAYVSDRTGQDQVYVRPYPDGPETPVSRNGGTQPRWSRTGMKLHFVEHDTLFAVNVKGETSFFVDSPIALFADSGLVQPFPGTRMYDVGVDGKMYLVVTPTKDAHDSPPVIRVVQNWYEAFRGREQN
jgi:serine/threonine-protein kinase